MFATPSPSQLRSPTRRALGALVAGVALTVATGAFAQKTLEWRYGHMNPPTSASGMLGRARALQDQGARWQDVLDAASAGLAQDSGIGTVRSELEVLRLEALVEVGRPEEAREAARAYLASGSTTRRADVERIAAQLESSLGSAQ